MKISGLSEKETRELIPHTPILVGYVGSIAHNTFIPSNEPDSTDDKDIMGVVLGPKEIYIGLSNFEGTNRFLGEYDVVTYEFRKYVRLLLKSNPNVLSLLWLDSHLYIYKDWRGDLLLRNRDLFVSKALYKSFTGYAYSQLKRMEAFNREGYMGAKRKALVEKYSFDTKNASHLIRLLRMGIEFLNEGILYVSRCDRDDLIAIKRGKWSLEKVKTEAERLFRRAEESYDRCTLPAKPNFAKVESLVEDILFKHLCASS